MMTMGLELGDLCLLTDVLVATDALFWPVRFNHESSEAFHATHERRLAFEQRGVELTCGGDATSRKAFERQVDALRARALLVVQSASGRRVGARLTEDADDWLRAVISLPTLAESWPLLATFDELANAVGVKTQGGCIWEGSLVREPHGTRAHDLQVYHVTESLLPAAWRGLVASLSDARGCIGWRLTDKGRAALKGNPPTMPTLPEWTDSWRAVENAVYEHYLASADAALKGRERWERKLPNGMTIPLSAGRWKWNDEIAKPTKRKAKKSSRKSRKAG